MPLHRTFQFVSARSCLHVEYGIESMQLEEVAMRFARRWAWPTVANALEVVLPLTSTIVAILILRYALRQIGRFRRNVPDEPVCPCAHWGIRVISYERKRLGSFWRVSPRQFGGEISPIAGVLFRNYPAFRECGRLNSE